MKIKSILIVASIGMMFAACSSRDDVSSDGEQIPVRITAGIKSMETSSSGDPDQLQNEDFLNGAKITVYLEDQGTTANLPGVPKDPGYLVYTKGETGWTTTVANLYWYSSGIDAFGIYPTKDAYNNTIDKSASIFMVYKTQVDDSDYRISDLMYAFNTNTTKGAPINLQFKHCLSKITVKLDPTSLYTVEQMKANMDYIRMHNIVLQAALSFSSSNLTAKGTGDPSTSHFNDVTFGHKNEAEALCSTGISCIIPPQTVAEGKQLFSVIYNADWGYYYTVPSGGLTFEGGKEYIFNLKLSNTNVTLSEPTVKSWTVVNRDQELMK